MDCNKEMFMRIARVLDYEIGEKDEKTGDIILSSNDKVGVNKVYIGLLENWIDNMTRLIEFLEHDAKEKIGKEKYIAVNEVFEMKIKLLDLHCEFVAKNNYNDNFVGRVNLEQQQMEVEMRMAQAELPALIEEATNIVNASGDVFDKLTTLLFGLVLRCENPNVYLTTPQAVNQTWKDLKKALEDYHKRQPDNQSVVGGDCDESQSQPLRLDTL